MIKLTVEDTRKKSNFKYTMSFKTDDLSKRRGVIKLVANKIVPFLTKVLRAARDR